MDINKIIKDFSNPKPYNKGTQLMWTDPRITPRLLDAHLDKNDDAASRTPKKIENTIHYISTAINLKDEKIDILDLGCGPGLYTQKLAKMGHRVTGIDLSENSLNYAKHKAEDENLDIKYICQNYVELDYNHAFDAIILIYCDFGVLSIEDRERLIGKIFNALKSDGVFIFDALNRHFLDTYTFSKTWECSESGFWRSTPHICMSQNIHYENKKTFLEQHLILEDDEYEIYRFWNHYFNLDDVKKMFLSHGFTNVEATENVLEIGAHMDETVTFYKITK